MKILNEVEQKAAYKSLVEVISPQSLNEIYRSLAAMPIDTTYLLIKEANREAFTSNTAIEELFFNALLFMSKNIKNN